MTTMRLKETAFRLKPLLAVLLVIAIAGCSASPAPTQAPQAEVPTQAPQAEVPTQAPAASSPTTGPTASASSGTLRIGVLLSNPVDDRGWSYVMQQAVLKLGEERGYEVSISEQVAAADAERVAREYAANGYDLIIAHSFGFGEAILKVAAEYPHVNFAWAGGMQKTAQNVADYDQPFYQAAYLMGIMAGGTSKSGIFSFIAGFDNPVSHSQYEAFKLGVEKMNPDSKVLYTFLGSWTDFAKGKEAVLAHIDAGADFATASGLVVGSIEAARERGIFASGYVGNMTEIAPDTVIMNLVWDVYPLLTAMADDVENGTFQPGKWYSLGVKEGALRVELNPALEENIPAEAMKEAQAAEQGMIDGTFEVPYIPQAQ